MKYWLTLLSMIMVVTLAYGQESMMSGIVLDENNKLVPGATLKITRKNIATEVRVGEDGMYYSPLLKVGAYIVDIYLKGKFYTAGKVHLAASKEATVYYNYRLNAGSKAELYSDEYYPLLRLKAGERVPQGE